MLTKAARSNLRNGPGQRRISDGRIHGSESKPQQTPGQVVKHNGGQHTCTIVGPITWIPAGFCPQILSYWSMGGVIG